MIEKEKAQAIEGLKDAQRSTDEANEKLREAQMAQKQAQENSEIEKFRAVEMEQAAIKSTYKKEQECQRELEAVRKEHALDVAALLSATEELKKVEQELSTNLEAKNQAIVHADDVTKIAEIHAQKIECLSAEVARLKALLDTKLENEADESTQLLSELHAEVETLKQELEKAKSQEQKLVEKEAHVKHLNVELEAAKLAESSIHKSMEEWQKKVKDLEAEAGESTQLVSELDLEIQTLKQELEKSKSYDQKLVEKEACIEKLNIELEAAKLAKLSALKLMEEWQKKAKVSEAQAEESNRLERSASESLESVMKQLEGSIDLLNDAESEIASLREKVGLLEISITRQRGDLEESERQLSVAKDKVAEMTKKVESLGYELDNVEEEKNQALNNEKLAAESVQTLLEEKNKLINELESLRDKEQQGKKSMESLATALQEVSSQAREAKERLASSQTEQENYENQIENLRLVLNATNDKYKTMLDEAKHETDMLIDTIEQNKQGYQNSRTEWEQKEANMMNSVKKSEDENSSLRREISKLAKLLKEAEEEAGARKEEGAWLNISLKEAESEVVYLKEIIGKIRAESITLKESFLVKENEMQSVIEENDELRRRETASIEKMEELTKLLDEARRQKQAVLNGELCLSENDKDYSLPAKVVECYEQNGHGGEEEKPKIELPPQLSEEKCKLDSGSSNVDEVGDQKLNENQKDYENKEKEEESREIDVKMWEILKSGEKELRDDKDKEQEKEGVEKEMVDCKVDDDDDDNDQVNGLSWTEMVENGGTSPSPQHQEEKKKKKEASTSKVW